MTLVYSFLFCGLVCLIAQLILDNTKYSPGHLTSAFVILGSVLGTFNLYDKVIGFVGAGASIPIISFGNTLLNSAYQGYLTQGFLGIFANMLAGVGVGIVSAVVFAYFLSLIFKVRD